MSIRWDAQTTLATHLATEVTPGNGYTVDLSIAGSVSNDISPIFERQTAMLGDAHVQIEEGREDHIQLELSPDTLREATFEIVLSCLVRGQATSASLRERANQFLADINLGLHKNPTLGGVVRRIHVARVDEPAYQPDEELAHMVIRLACVYFYTAGTDI